MGEGAQARCRAHAAIRRRIAQARELSGRIGAALQISAALCARGGWGVRFVRPLPVGLNCTVPRVPRGTAGGGRAPPSYPPPKTRFARK